MAIMNLAGNIQPASISGGRELPQKTSRASSTTLNPKIDDRVTVTKINQLVVTKPISGNSDVIQVEVSDQIEKLRLFNQSIDRSLKFEIDEDLGVTIVRVVDKKTDELIRQFPPEELLNLSRRLKQLNEQNTGNISILLEEKV